MEHHESWHRHSLDCRPWRATLRIEEFRSSPAPRSCGELRWRASAAHPHEGLRAFRPVDDDHASDAGGVGRNEVDFPRCRPSLFDRARSLGARRGVPAQPWAAGNRAPYLLTLYEATAENVHLVILDGMEALYVARLVGPRSVPTISRMGGRLPLHTTGVGKALLAWQDDAFLDAYFARELERPTKFSIASEPKLRAQLAEIRRNCYSQTHQEMTLGNISLAVPVLGRHGVPLAAVGLVTHTVRADVGRLVSVLRNAAAGMAASLLKLMDRDGSDSFH